jgi:LPS O-antigen subunit length determinant protein (WzzB/FepE family)
MQHDEIYLIDMWRIFRRQWRWSMAVLVLVLAATFAYAHTAKPQWEATAWIQVGQIGPTPVGQDPKVEPFQRVIQRLQSLAFQSQVMQSVGIAPAAPEARLYIKSFKLDPEPYANLIKVSLRARSREQASQFAQATLAQLQAIHRRIAAPPLALAKQRLDEIQADLQSAQADRDRLLRAAGDSAANKNTDGSVMAGMLLSSKNGDIRNLQQARNELLIRLSPNYTYETSSLWPIYAPVAPASPNFVLVWGLGILLGLFLAVLVAVARNAGRR